jgi:hypothetical protein
MKSAIRLYVILARKSPLGVVFRRGPSNQVLLIKWNTADDSFEYGQWLKGRIYERRCDLLFASGGCLFRLPLTKGALAPLEHATKIADFTGLKFEPVEAPRDTRRWPRT